MWSGFVIALGWMYAFSGISDRVLLITAAVLLPFLGAMEWALRRQIRSGKPLVMLTDKWIESVLFTSKRKRYTWDEIATLSMETANNVPTFQLTLSTASRKPQFWSRTATRPRIVLSALAPEDQERLYTAIYRHLPVSAVSGEAPDQTSFNPLTAAREFQSSLKLLTPQPWVVYFIVAINLAVWLAMLNAGAGLSRTSAPMLLQWGGNVAYEVQHGQWWRMLAAVFLHSGPVHLMMNMLGLLGAGVMVERIYGHRLFALLYLSSGLVGSALSMHYSAQTAVSVGASGAVFGVAGALLVAVFQHRKTLPQAFSRPTLTNIGVFVVYSLVHGLGKQDIDNAAHIGGLVAGACIALVLPERFNMAVFSRSWMPRAVNALIMTVAASFALAAAAPKSSMDLRNVMEGTARFEKAMETLAAKLQEIQKEDAAMKAGVLDQRVADMRNQEIHAPVLRRVASELARSTLRPGDRRQPLLAYGRRYAELLAEALAMPSVAEADGKTLVPSDPERANEIERELIELTGKFEQWRESNKPQKGSAKRVNAS
jgi:rhomboid protease GluP